MSKNIAAAILAGGKALRFNGFAKGNILLAPNVTVIEHLLIELNQAGLKEVVLAGENPEYRRYQLLMIADKHKNIGPLAGIEAVLEHYQDRFSATLFLPCDLPRITAQEIRKLIDQYEDKIVFAANGTANWHPLCVIVQNSLLPEIRASIDNGVRSVKEAWCACNAKPIFFSDEAMFVNLNSWRDFS